MDLTVAIGLAATVGPMAVGSVVYLIRSETRSDLTRLQGRIERHEFECHAIRDKQDERHQAVTKQLDEIKAGMRDANQKLDKALGLG